MVAGAGHLAARAVRSPILYIARVGKDDSGAVSFCSGGPDLLSAKTPAPVHTAARMATTALYPEVGGRSLREMWIDAAVSKEKLQPLLRCCTLRAPSF